MGKHRAKIIKKIQTAAKKDLKKSRKATKATKATTQTDRNTNPKLSTDPLSQQLNSHVRTLRLSTQPWPSSVQVGRNARTAIDLGPMKVMCRWPMAGVLRFWQAKGGDARGWPY